MPTSKSLRVGDVGFVREIFTVEVYLATAGETEINALIAPPWATLPWTGLVLMEEAVVRGWAAFSEAEAARRKIPQLDLVRSTALASKLVSLLDQLQREGFRPPALPTYVTEEEARRRWQSLSAFFNANGHFLVTNGSYKLRSWGSDHATLEAFRDLSYPLGVGSFDAFAIPRRGYITAADWNGRRLILSGEIEVLERYQRNYRLVRTPLKSVPRPTLVRSAPKCRYSGPDGRVLAAGTVEASADAACAIDLGDRFPPGRYTLAALLAVNGKYDECRNQALRSRHTSETAKRRLTRRKSSPGQLQKHWEQSRESGPLAAAKLDSKGAKSPHAVNVWRTLLRMKSQS